MKKNKKTVVILGGSGLIGRNLVHSLSDDWNVVSADLTLPSSVKDSRIFFLKVNITSESSLRNLIARVIKKYGVIDAVVNCAYPRGKNYGAKLEGVSYNDFCENLNLHLGGYFLVCKIFSEYFKTLKTGNLVQFASIYGVRAPRFEIYPSKMTTPVEYAAIKSGIIHLNSYFAKYYGKSGVRFNCVSPGGVFNQQNKKFIKNYSKFSMNSRMLSPSDLTGLIRFLISDESKMITGQNIIIDDGWTL